jgi:hypothetical protein
MATFPAALYSYNWTTINVHLSFIVSKLYFTSRLASLPVGGTTMLSTQLILGVDEIPPLPESSVTRLNFPFVDPTLSLRLIVKGV